jgi:hypothetical protein
MPSRSELESSAFEFVLDPSGSEASRGRMRRPAPELVVSGSSGGCLGQGRSSECQPSQTASDRVAVAGLALEGARGLRTPRD